MKKTSLTNFKKYAILGVTSSLCKNIVPPDEETACRLVIRNSSRVEYCLC
ncbi:MAG: hypothetical protein K2O52_06760 [Oscillospiraceae bacterium]|nr:hypothetical protein [Oscillospiraceae bacterium]MDE7094593.1 hypothetical protein [Oscillospiraceae bacterium]